MLKQFFIHLWHVFAFFFKVALVATFIAVSGYAGIVLSRFATIAYGPLAAKVALVGTGVLLMMFVLAMIMTYIFPKGF